MFCKFTSKQFYYIVSSILLYELLFDIVLYDKYLKHKKNTDLIMVAKLLNYLGFTMSCLYHNWCELFIRLYCTCTTIVYSIYLTSEYLDYMFYKKERRNEKIVEYYTQDIYPTILLINNAIYLLYNIFQIKISDMAHERQDICECSIYINCSCNYNCKCSSFKTKLYKILSCFKESCCYFSCQSKYNKQLEDIDCSICLSTIKLADKHILKCGHILHVQCYKQLIKSSNSCPLCRDIINIPNIVIEV